MNKLRIAVAGAGSIGRRHIEEIQRSHSTQLAAIVDVTADAQRIASREGVTLYPSLQQLFTAGMTDGVILATPNALHVDQALQCVAAGVPVLVEKPLAHTLADGERLVAAAEQAGAKLLVGHHRRHSPILASAIAIIQSGALGPIVAVQGSAVFRKPDTGYFDGPFTWRREPGGGPILINMIHEVDNLRALVGEIVAVQALASSAARQFAVEDTVAINLRFAGGALGTFLLSDTAASPRSWEQTSRENEAYAHCSDEDAYVIMGTRGSLGIPTMRLRRYGPQDDPSWFTAFASETLPIAHADPLALQIEHFAAVIRGEAAPRVSGRDGLQNLRVVDAILSAAQCGGTIAVPPALTPAIPPA